MVAFLTLNGTAVLFTPSHGEHCWRVGGKNVRARGWGETQQKRSLLRMTQPLQTWIHCSCEYLHRPEHDWINQHSSWVREEPMRPHPSLRDYWQLVAVGEVPVIFCQWCSLWEDCFSTVHDLTLRLSQVMLIQLICEGHIQIRHDSAWRCTSWWEVYQWVMFEAEGIILLKSLKLGLESWLSG